MSQSQRSADRAPLGSRENFWGDSDADDDLVADTHRPEEAAAATGEEIQTCADKPGEETVARKCLSTEEIASEKAHKIWREVAPKWSPIALHEPPYAPSVSRALARSRATDGLAAPDPDRVLEAHEVWSLTAVLWGAETPEMDERSSWAVHRDNEQVEMTDPQEWLPRRFESEAGTWWTDYGAGRHRNRLDPEHGYATGPILGDCSRDLFLSVVDDVLSNAYEEYKVLTREDIERLQRDARRMKSASDISDEEALSRILADIFELSSRF